MQDRPGINVDSTLVDRGWEQMLHQLDEVMPVRKRRFFPWFLLLLFLVVGSSAGVYKAFQYEQGVNKGGIERSSKIPANLLENTPIAAVQEKDDSQIKEETVRASELEKESVLSQPNQIISVQTTREKEANSGIVNTFPVEGNVIQQNPIFETRKNKIIEEPVLSEPVLATEELIVTQRDTKEVALLALNNINLLEASRIDLDKKISFVAPKSIRFYAMAETEIGLSGDPQGLAFGVGFQKPLNQKISLELGVNYQFVSAKLVSNALGLGNKDSGEFFDPVENIYAGQAYSLSQTYNNLNIQRLNIPLQLRFKIGNRWHLAAGLQTTYYTKAIVKFDSVSQGVSLTPTPENNLDIDLYAGELSVFDLDTRTSTVSLPYNLKPNHWQWSGLLAAQFQLSNHIELEAKYRRNITNWPSAKDNFGAKSFVSLGLKYYLN